MHPIFKDILKIRQIIPPKESIDIINISILEHKIRIMIEKKIKNYNEFIFLYKYTKMPNDIINKILEYNY
jgi:hypothetical protein